MHASWTIIVCRNEQGAYNLIVHKEDLALVVLT